MSLQLSSVVIFFIIILPVAFAWHAFVDRYFLASLLAALNITALLLLFLLRNAQSGHYLGGIVFLGFVVTFLTALSIGLPFLLIRRKGKKREGGPG
ncbi:MAG: hypothetical protein P8130_13430 [Deltaproteobacteria bacterium]